ncbi:MAG TPA: hypothetical protein VJ875_23725 [Pyrinomonadaceae bacterium]|nr:hypothetical protein [Pyrinomonadaceae bacterium]
MSKVRFTFSIFATVVLALMVASVANAQATRTWVSGVGDDVNPCSRTAPCKTYAGAISKTAVNGEISTLDPGGFGAVTITKSITIEGTQGQGYGSILHSATTGVNIAFDSFTAVGETRKSVRLRNLNINGGDSGLRGIRISGGNPGSTNSEVFVEDCIIDGSNGSPGRGIEDARSGGGFLSVSGTTIRNMAGSGLSTLGNTAGLKIVVNKSQFLNCANGIAVSSNVKIGVYDSNMSGNSGAGLFVEDTDGGANTVMDVDHCIVAHNGTGFNATTGNSSIRVSNTTATNNTTLFSQAGGGTVLSYGNNQAGGVAFGGSVSPT